MLNVCEVLMEIIIDVKVCKNFMFEVINEGMGLSVVYMIVVLFG